MDGKLYYVSDDGSYHKLCKIKELEETIMVDFDEKEEAYYRALSEAIDALNRKE